MILINGVKLDAEKIPVMKKAALFELNSLYSRDRVDTDTGKVYKTKAGYYSIPSSYVVYDKSKNENVEIRYVKTDTPFMDASGKEVRRYMPHKVSFVGGILLVQVTDPDLLYWLKKHPFLEKEGNNDSRFRLVDAALNASDRQSSQLLEYRAMSLLIGDKQKAIYEQRNFLKSLSLGNNVDNISDDEVTDALITEAKKDPSAFIKKFSSAETDMKSMIYDAEKADYIKVGSESEKWVWGNKAGISAGSTIVNIPSGRVPLDFFMEWLMRTDNSGVLNELQLLTKRIGHSASTPKAKEDTIRELIEQAKELGVEMLGIAKLSEAELRKKIKEAQLVQD